MEIETKPTPKTKKMFPYLQGQSGVKRLKKLIGMNVSTNANMLTKRRHKSEMQSKNNALATTVTSVETRQAALAAGIQISNVSQVYDL